MVDVVKSPKVLYGRHVRLDPKTGKVAEVRQRMWSGAIREHDWTWAELSPCHEFGEYNTVAVVGKEAYVVWVVNVEDWPDGEKKR